MPKYSDKTTLKSGFTLVEMSLVILIIGLLIGGTLAGRALLYSAKVRSALKDIEQIQTATITFQEKYECLPGDCAHATKYFSGVTDGNGDEQIGVYGVSGYSEMWQFWYHLSMAGLFRGSYTGTQGSGGANHAEVGVNVPASKIGAGIGYTVLNWNGYTDNWNGWTSLGERTLTKHAILFGKSYLDAYPTFAQALTVMDALSIDTKVDDGKPGTGNWIHLYPLVYPNCATTLSPTTAVYNTATAGEACNFGIKTDF